MNGHSDAIDNEDKDDFPFSERTTHLLIKHGYTNEEFEHPYVDERKEELAGFDAFTNKESNMHGKWTKENFNEYHKNHPEIYDLFVKFTNMATQRKKYYSAKAIFHRIRWETMISGEGDYKIDDGWISHYARKFMDDFPQHQGFFQTRDRKNSYHKN